MLVERKRTVRTFVPDVFRLDVTQLLVREKAASGQLFVAWL